MPAQLPPDIDAIKGFLHPDEAQALYRWAQASSKAGPVLEIGSYCGKSTLYLGLAAHENGSTVFALDHHRGSEEHQQGEMFHDPALYDAEMAQVDTFRAFRHNIERAGLNDTVVPVVAGSAAAARHWQTPVGRRRAPSTGWHCNRVYSRCLSRLKAWLCCAGSKPAY